MKRIIIISTLIVMAIIPAISFAGDFWAETPDLNHNVKSTFALNETIVFNHRTSQADLWAETPDITSSEKKPVADQGIHKLFSNDPGQEMYAETPDLNVTF